jgi:CubicO group peptidase (beta-lactamase class C family)
MSCRQSDAGVRRLFTILVVATLLPPVSIGRAAQAGPKEDPKADVPAQAKTKPSIPAVVPKAPQESTPAKPTPKDASARQPQAPPQPASPAAPLERSDLEAFFDGALGLQVDDKHIAGAVVAVVVGDKVVFQKGYGYADVEARRKVDPETTMFRVGSITKTFTWTAVMQLVEQGKLNLDTDVNKYLKDFQVPATFNEPVTLKSCMTHTPGFEDSVIGLFAHKADAIKPLAQVLHDQFPTRVRPPGVLTSYSNHATALSGLVVASVAGKSWEEYVEDSILKPLGMKHTLVRQPPKDKLPATMSNGYKWQDGRFKEVGFEYIADAPAGTMAASAGDIARFLIAHMNDGQYQGARILKPETARLMREPLFRNDPKVDAMCYGFWEQHDNGQRVLQHGGATLVFFSLAAMIPDKHIGLFISCNTNTGAGQQAEILTTFLKHYFPQPDPPRPKPKADFAQTGKRFAGEYASTRYSHTTYAKLVELMQTDDVHVNDDGTITLSTPAGARRFVEVEPLVFQQLDGDRRIVFRADEKGTITHLFPAYAAAVALERHEWYQRIDFHKALLAASLVLFASAVLIWPAIGFATRGLTSPTIRRSRVSGLASVIGFLLSAACLAVVAGVLVGMSDSEEVAFGTPATLKWVLAVPQVCVALAALTLVFCLVAWKQRYWRFSGRLHYTLVALAGVGFCWFTYYWNLLHFGAVSQL